MPTKEQIEAALPGIFNSTTLLIFADNRCVCKIPMLFEFIGGGTLWGNGTGDGYNIIDCKPTFYALINKNKEVLRCGSYKDLGLPVVLPGACLVQMRTFELELGDDILRIIERLAPKDRKN